MAELETSAYAGVTWPGLSVAKWTPRPPVFKGKVCRATKLQVNVIHNSPLAATLGSNKQIMS